jgi:hypothetical protein
MAFTNVSGAKLDKPTLDHILKYYGRFGNRQQQIDAYLRRKERQRRGVHNLSHASHQQISALQRKGLIGQQANSFGLNGEFPQALVDRAAANVSGGAFGEGSGKVPALTAVPIPPEGPGGITRGPVVADPQTGGVAPPPAVPPLAMAQPVEGVSLADVLASSYNGRHRRHRRRHPTYPPHGSFGGRGPYEGGGTG